MTDQEKTINQIEQSMRTWINEQLDAYEQMPAAQIMTTTQGERVYKANPAIQEIRAAFKDYCYIVKTQKELSDGKAVDTSAVDDLRKRFKVAK